MNKTGWVIIVIVIVLLVGGGIWYWMSMSNPNTSNSSTYNTTGTQNQAKGTMVLSVTDAAASMKNVSEVTMVVDKVDVYSNTQGWVTVSQTPQTFNLLELKSKNQAKLLVQADVPTDTYSQIKFHVSQLAVTESGVVKNAVLPSNDFNLSANVTVAPNVDASATFDIMADKSLHKTAKGDFVFAPVVTFNSSSNANVQVDANNVVTISGGTANPSVNAGMDVDGTVKANFQIDPSAKLDVNGGVVQVLGAVNTNTQVNTNPQTLPGY
jgi:hypothetical protein